MTVTLPQWIKVFKIDRNSPERDIFIDIQVTPVMILVSYYRENSKNFLSSNNVYAKIDYKANRVHYDLDFLYQGIMYMLHDIDNNGGVYESGPDMTVSDKGGYFSAKNITERAGG